MCSTALCAHTSRMQTKLTQASMTSTQAKLQPGQSAGPLPGHTPLKLFKLCVFSAVDAQGQAEAMRGRMRWAASQLGLAAAEAAARLDRLAFATLPVSGLSDVGANFLPYLLDHWRSPRKVLVAGAGAREGVRTRVRVPACARGFLHACEGFCGRADSAASTSMSASMALRLCTTGVGLPVVRLVTGTCLLATYVSAARVPGPVQAAMSC